MSAPTLEAIGLTLATGAVIATVSLLGFGLAVARRSVLIAPRAAARPRNVIHNPRPTSPSQDRGTPIFGWIPWTLSLTYDTMLRGIPGTGTREGGLSGRMLNVTMDGIILLRFHALGLRISIVATVICMGILLPLYYTAQCYGHDIEFVHACSPDSYNVTDYQRTTLANIPSADEATREAEIGVLSRLYLSSICFCAFILSVLYFLKQEWIEVLAMRRVYYLEKDIWAARRNELKETMLHDEVSKEKAKQNQRHSFRENDQKQSAVKNVEREPSFGSKDHLEHREPWIPHPEQRDTVPNVSLYSVLVGGLPTLPVQAVRKSDPEFSDRHSRDWQLALTSNIFDHCVPNQPGFSSSIAAVTIIPGAKEMSLAWRKWYAAASKLRRLRFIRRQIAERRHYDIEVGDEADLDEEIIQDVEEYYSTSQLDEVQGEDSDEKFLPPLVTEEEAPSADNFDETVTPRPIYSELSKRKAYFRQVLGTSVTHDLDSQVYETVTFGPEQASIYSREFAQAAAACCPNGCREDRIRNARIDELLELEREATEEVHKANLELNEVRRNITNIGPQDSAGEGKSDSEGPDIRRSQLQNDLDLEASLYNRARSEDLARRRIPDCEARSEAASERLGSHTGSELLSSGVEELAGSHLQRAPSSSDWDHVQSIVRASAGDSTIPERASNRTHGPEIASGMWKFPSSRRIIDSLTHSVYRANRWIKDQTVDAVDSVARDSTYAIVTFTSRQAAVAARKCLADGRGGERWLSVHDIPIPPLADAPACDVMACRNCLRPVTVSVSNRQKSFRQIM